ncbi:hypothetical protein [Succinivibrio dextrinosolvens]|uniref:hypothetical protein n=1 Tax=Succinivibrio dextrinosolvens TaxID=83771 RepID=UPI0004E27B72|nr:hypothetical protein [Succinivibrio dextrinosolvens]
MSASVASSTVCILRILKETSDLAILFATVATSNLNINREALFVLILAPQNRVSKIGQKQTFKELHTCKKIWKNMQKLVNLTTK